MPLLLLLNQQQPLEVPEGARAIVLTNAGTGSVTIGTVTLTDDTDGAFTIVVDAASGRTLAPGETATIAVDYSPTEEGTDEGQVRVPSSDPDGVLFVSLRGVRLPTAAPAIAVDPPSWDFGSVAGASGRPQVAITITNAGTADLVLGTIVLSGADLTQIGTDPSGGTIAPGGSKTYAVRFTPSTTGAKSGSVTIPSNAGADVVVGLTGTGTKTLSVFPTSWDAGSVTVTGGSSTLSAVVKSTGTVPVTAGTVAVTGSGFTKGTDNVSSQVLDPAETATVAVIFDPSSTGAKSGSLSIPSDATGSPLTVALSGTGVTDTVTPPDPPTPPTPTIEVTRLYLGRQAAPIVLPSGHAAGWWQATTEDPHALTVVKGGPPVANATAVYARRGEQSLHGTWVSPPLAAQAIDTTFSCILPAAWRSTALGDHVTSALRFLVWRAATNTLSFGPVLAHAGVVEPWVSTSETALPRRFPAGGPRTWNVALTIAAGDRIVVQLGCKVNGGPADVFSAPTRIRYGGSSTQADNPGSIHTAAPDTAGWLDLTDPLIVLDE